MLLLLLQLLLRRNSCELKLDHQLCASRCVMRSTTWITYSYTLTMNSSRLY